MWNSDDVVDEESEDSEDEADDDKDSAEHEMQGATTKHVGDDRQGAHRSCPLVGMAADEEIEDMLEVWKRKRTLKSER
jgi:hypothetical protein